MVQTFFTMPHLVHRTPCIWLQLVFFFLIFLVSNLSTYPSRHDPIAASTSTVNVSSQSHLPSFNTRRLIAIPPTSHLLHRHVYPSGMYAPQSNCIYSVAITNICTNLSSGISNTARSTGNINPRLGFSTVTNSLTANHRKGEQAG